MAFWDNISQKASETTAKAMQKAKEMSDIAKFNSMISEEETKINNYRQQIQDIKGVVRCSQCGAEVQSGVAFCSSCGTPMPKVQPINTDDIVRCESCGAMVKKGVHFCTSCGKPMTQMIAPEAISVPVAESEGQNSVCPKCGAKIETGVAFCTECGTKL